MLDATLSVIVTVRRVVRENPLSLSLVMGAGFDPLIDRQPSRPMLAVNTTEPCWSDGVPVTIVDCAGASFPAGWGTLAWHSFWPVQVSVLCALLVGATGPTLADGALSPTEFRATTEHVYGAPLVSPETTRGLPNPPFDLSAPLGEVHDATKAVAGDPPAPASNETVTVPSPAISVRSRVSRNATCPGVWPGVAITSRLSTRSPPLMRTSGTVLTFGQPPGTLPTSPLVKRKVRLLPSPPWRGAARTPISTTPTAMTLQCIVRSPSP